MLAWEEKAYDEMLSGLKLREDHFQMKTIRIGFTDKELSPEDL
jgi:hypothetical protein